MTAPHRIVIDVEATCSADRRAVPRDEMEIIELGAVLLDGDDLHEIDAFQCFVRPVRHPVLTPFCTQLTTITQQQVDAGLPFARAVAELTAFADRGRACEMCSWGRFDRTILTRDCAWHGVPPPPFVGHLDVKHDFRKQHRLHRGLGVREALAHLGWTFSGTPHRGLDDARNIARLFRSLGGETG